MRSGRQQGAARKITRIRIKNAGGYSSRYILVAEYAPTAGVKKLLSSNHPRYGISWASKEDIGEADETAFMNWVDGCFARGGSAFKSPAAALVSPPSLPIRSSMRVNAAMESKVVVDAGEKGGFEVEMGVLQCVRFLIHNVVHRARYRFEVEGQVRINFVEGKQRHRRADWVARCSGSQPRLSGLTKKMRAAKLTQRRSRGYRYRIERLKRAAAARTEDDLGWLDVQRLRLATVVSRQDLHELLPEGAASCE